MDRGSWVPLWTDEVAERRTCSNWFGGAGMSRERRRLNMRIRTAVALGFGVFLLGQGGPGTSQDSGGVKPTVQVCPRDFIAGWNAQFLVTGNGFQPLTTTVKVNGKPADATIVSSSHQVFTTALGLEDNEVRITTPGGSTSGIAIRGRDIEDLPINELFARVEQNFLAFAELNELLKPFQK